MKMQEVHEIPNKATGLVYLIWDHRRISPSLPDRPDHYFEPLGNGQVVKQVPNHDACRYHIDDEDWPLVAKTAVRSLVGRELGRSIRLYSTPQRTSYTYIWQGHFLAFRPEELIDEPLCQLPSVVAARRRLAETMVDEPTETATT